MRKIILSLLFVIVSVSLMAQAKKPTIMVIPSDAYCSRHGYTTEWIDENGNLVKEKISYEETRNYLKKVSEYYENYKNVA